MTRKEAARQLAQYDTLSKLGITFDDAEALRRISMTLHRWYERECGDGNGCIERHETTGRPYWHASGDSGYRHRWSIPDRERGAKKRLARIMAKYPQLRAYLQTDPRGAVLYILRPGDIPEGGAAESYYSRGICVY